MKNIKLNNDVEIPIVGSGTNTYGKEGNQYSGALRGDTQEIDWAIENGYRHFDSAQVVSHYQIERDVIVIPKSHNKDRQAQSLDIFNFELKANDRERIAAL